MTRLCRVVCLSLVTIPSAFTPLAAQQPAPRIQSTIEASPSVPLPGSLDPHIRSAAEDSKDVEDLGALAPETPIPGITLVFKRSPAQEADLQQLLAQQSNPASPLYRHWLTPQSFAARFGLADADIAAATVWLRTHGFHVDSISPSRDRVTFSGNALQVQQAFGAELHRYRWHNELHTAPSSALSLPSELAPVTAAVLHLSSFRPRPNANILHPHFTTSSSQSHLLGPRDIATLYDLGPLYNNGYNGLGQGLAIVGETFVNTSSDSSIAFFQEDLTQFTAIQPVLVPNSGVEAILPGDEAESDIDLEYASGIAQNATIFFVYVGANPNYSVFDSLAFAITQDIAPVISISYGLCEPLMSSTDLSQENALFEQAAAQGQTIVSSSGDAGALGCADYGSSTSQQQALAVNFPASSPYVTALGGTQMAPGTFTAGSSSYWSSDTDTGNLTNSLLSYVPETAWNEDSTTAGLLSSGGGVSSVFPRPSWQSGVPGIPSGAFRLVPDIALQASTQSPGFVFCTDEALGSGIYDCSEGVATGGYVVSGGTSFAAPIFAGFVALLNQYEETQGLGNLNPTLYSLAANPSTYAAAFHDITTGTTACSAGDGPCGGVAESIYAATPGYDEATGLGSLDFNQLAAAWPSAPASNNLSPTIITFTNNPQGISAGDSVSLQFTVGPFNEAQGLAAPTGTVAIFVDGQVMDPSLAFTSTNPAEAFSSVTYNLVAPSAPGSHLIVVRYPGDATHLPSTATESILVGDVTASGSVTLAANSLSVPANGTGSTEVTVTPFDGYNGVLTWSLSLSALPGAPALTACYLIDSVRINGSTQVKLTLGAGTACNSPFPSLASTPPNVLRSSVQKPPRRKPAIPSAFYATLLLCALLPLRRHRKRVSLLLLAFLAIAAINLSGCGGGGSGNGGGPTSASYSVTLTGQDSVNNAIQSNTVFTLTVN